MYGSEDAVIMEVMLPFERNIFDSIPNELTLIQQGVPMLRATLPEIPPNVVFNAQSKALYYRGFEVAVVYLRSLYSASHFT